jgi:hypothetical protein
MHGGGSNLRPPDSNTMKEGPYPPVQLYNSCDIEGTRVFYQVPTETSSEDTSEGVPRHSRIDVRKRRQGKGTNNKKS